jgi:hypothetical protein
MQLVLKREQRSKGMMSKSVVFVLHARADLSEEEKHNVEKYKLGDQVIYNSEASRKHLDAGAATSNVAGKLARLAMAKMSLNITINSLMNGHEITCSTLEEAAEAQDAIKKACEAMQYYIAFASTFDGRQEVVEIAAPAVEA